MTRRERFQKAEAFREAAKIARGYGPGRPMLNHARRDPLIKGRWEGEQAASGAIAHLLDLEAQRVAGTSDDPQPSECWPDDPFEGADIHEGAVTVYRNGVERGLCLDCGRSWEV